MSERQPPKTLYIQWYGDQDEPLEEPPYGSEVSWCQEQIWNHDVRYVRDDRFRAAVDELNRLLDCVSAEDDAIITEVLNQLGD